MRYQHSRGKLYRFEFYHHPHRSALSSTLGSTTAALGQKGLASKTSPFRSMQDPPAVDTENRNFKPSRMAKRIPKFGASVGHGEDASGKVSEKLHPFTVAQSWQRGRKTMNHKFGCLQERGRSNARETATAHLTVLIFDVIQRLAFDTWISPACHDPGSCLAHGSVYITRTIPNEGQCTFRFRHPSTGARVGMESARARVPQNESQSLSPRIRPAGEKKPSPDSSPISPERLAKLGVESGLIPFITSTTSQIEQSPNDLHSLSPAHAKTLVEILDKVHLPP